jgi:hypothetical protein
MYSRLTYLFCLLWACHARVTLEDNGYKGLVIAIGDYVREDSSLIDHIMAVMTNASAYMFTATRYRAYFKDITILVPQTWGYSSSYKDATHETFDDAEIRVDEPATPGDHAAYVRGSALVCGMPGLYMHVTPHRLTNEQVRRSARIPRHFPRVFFAGIPGMCAARALRRLLYAACHTDGTSLLFVV